MLCCHVLLVLQQMCTVSHFGMSCIGSGWWEALLGPQSWVPTRCHATLVGEILFFFSFLMLISPSSMKSWQSNEAECIQLSKEKK